MNDEPLTCGKCKTILEINSEHVIFKGGKTAYIKCPNSHCNNTRRIAFDIVEHLKPVVEAVKPVNQEDTGNKAEQHELTKGEKKEGKKETIRPLMVESETVILKAPDTSLEKEFSEQETEGGMIWGAVAAFFALLFGIIITLYLWWHNRKEGETT